jgi:hypothetical protein
MYLHFGERTRASQLGHGQPCVEGLDGPSESLSPMGAVLVSAPLGSLPWLRSEDGATKGTPWTPQL